MLTLVAALVLTSNWSQKLPDGTTVKLVAVSNAGAKKFWSPEGKGQKPPTLTSAIRPTDIGGKNELAFFCQLGSAQLPSVAFKVGTQFLPSGFTVMEEKNSKAWWAGTTIANKKLPKQLDLKVGVGTGKWKLAATYSLQTGESKGPKFFGFVLRDMKKPWDGVVAIDCTIPKSVVGKSAYEIRLFDASGKAMTPTGSGPMKAGQKPKYFYIDRKQRLIRADLMTRPYKWITFKGVSTKAK